MCGHTHQQQRQPVLKKYWLVHILSECKWIETKSFFFFMHLLPKALNLLYKRRAAHYSTICSDNYHSRAIAQPAGLEGCDVNVCVFKMMSEWMMALLVERVIHAINTPCGCLSNEWKTIWHRSQFWCIYMWLKRQLFFLKPQEVE